MKTESYLIEGMSCAACSSAIERVTRKLEGVSQSDVNLATNKMAITYDEKLVNQDTIMHQVEKAGFKASLVNEDKSLKEQDTEAWEKQEILLSGAKKRLIIAICFAIPLLYISMGHMLPFPLPLPDFLDMKQNPFNFSMSQLLLTIPILICGRRFYLVGIRSMIKGNPNMDSLVAIGTGSAFLYSLIMTIGVGKNHSNAHHLYYESAAIVVTLVMLGKYMESRSKGKTSEAIRKLMELAPDTAVLIEDGREREVETSTIQTGQVLLIKPGSRVPLDGTVIEGSSSVDESMLTGESIPVEKQAGDPLIGGSMNYNGAMKMKVTHTGEDTTLSNIIHLIEQAQGKKAPISKLADKVAGYFVPAVMVIAVVCAFLWWAWGGGDITFVLRIFVSVLVIACPCALGLATPTAIMVGTGLGAGHGILIKSGEALETAYKVDTVVLDKTGTITEGRPRVTDILSVDGEITKEEILRVAASCEQLSEHPLGASIVEEARQRGISLSYPEQFESITGSGIYATLEQKEIYIGNMRMLIQQKIPVNSRIKESSDQMAEQGKTPMYLVMNGVLSGIISVADTIKESSTSAIDQMKALGIQVYMLTGDNQKTAEHIGSQAHIDTVIAEVLPQDKANVVADLQKQGKIVMMVGDGINDAPALVQANVGTAIGSGSDIALDSADIVLMKSDLSDVYKAIILSKATIRNIKQNLFWAFFYNTLGIPVAAGFLYLFGGPLLSPLLAGFAMSLSSVCVVGNALRLKTLKI